MMQRLRPSALDDVGLVETLKEEVRAWQARQPDTKYRLNIAGNLDMLGDLVNITIYRIVQECLTNIAKHSIATEVDIQLSLVDVGHKHNLYLEVRDNGMGMKPQSLGRGFGLIGMRERAEALNGKFELLTDSSAGMTVAATLPLSGSEES